MTTTQPFGQSIGSGSLQTFSFGMLTIIDDEEKVMIHQFQMETHEWFAIQLRFLSSLALVQDGVHGGGGAEIGVNRNTLAHGT